MADSMVNEIQAKSILVQSKLPDSDYVINPYTGCAFGCSYCYASFMGRFVNKSIDEWGSYVFAKVNLPEVLEKELSRLKDKTKSIFLSSVTDPYQGIEQKYRLTRRALELLQKYNWRGSIGILTKSSLVTRDIDLFKKMKNLEVGLTITSTDDDISRFFERAAPPVSLRLKALKELHDAGIKTYAFIGPLLPHYSANPAKLRSIFDALVAAGVKEIYMEHINLSPYIRERLLNKIKGVDQEILDKFYAAGSRDYRDELNAIIKNILKNYNFKLRGARVLEHGKDKLI